MRHFVFGCLILSLLVLTVAPAVCQSIFVSNDEHFTSDPELNQVDDTQLALNVAAWLTANAPGKHILILSSNSGLNNSLLVSKLSGYNVDPPTSTVPVSLLTAAGAPMWDAIFVSGDCRNYPLTFGTAVCANGFALLDNMLTSYVAAGGNVFLEVGLTCNAGDPTWNPFLHMFGLSVVHGCNGILNSNVNVSAFQTQSPYGPDLFNGVNTVYIDNGEDVLSLGTTCGTQAFTDANGNGLYAAWRPCCAHNTPNRLVNGSFETGNFAGWTTGGNFEFTSVVNGPFYVYTGAQDGLCYAVLGPVGSDGTLYQSFPTTPGTQYTIRFWVNAVGDDPSDFTAFWDGTELLAVTDPNTGGAWTEFAFTVTGTGFDTLGFTFRDDPAYIGLDNVSVLP